MAQNSNIEWTDRTFNPWIGCTKVSDGCKNCYAETMMDKRYGKVKWGPTGTRVRTSAANWKKPLAWNKTPFFECSYCGWRGEEKALIQAGLNYNLCPSCESKEIKPTRQRVFCASLADVFEDKPELLPWLEELFGLICDTPNIDWPLLTKRIENAQRMTDEILGPVRLSWSDLPNVWIGTSVENQEQADKRIPELLEIPAKVRFLSCEPLLSAINLTPFLDNLHWVIVGGESGPHARPMHPDWVRSIRDQCQAAGVPFFFKQWGEWLHFGHGASTGTGRGKYHQWSRFPFDWSKAVGKHAAGRLLDGRKWGEFPNVPTS